MTNGTKSGAGKSAQTPQQGGQKGSSLAPNIASLLCYLCMPFTAIIFLAIEKDEADVRYHAWQGTVLGIVSVALFIATFIVSNIFRIMPAFLSWIAWLLSAILMPLEVVTIMVIAIICMIKAYQGERWRIPYIGDYAARKAGV